MVKVVDLVSALNFKANEYFNVDLILRPWKDDSTTFPENLLFWLQTGL